MHYTKLSCIIQIIGNISNLVLKYFIYKKKIRCRNTYKNIPNGKPSVYIIKSHVVWKIFISLNSLDK